MIRRPPRSPLFPYTTLSRSIGWAEERFAEARRSLVRLDCMAANPDLRAYYERLGFECRGTKQLNNGFAAALYERPIDRKSTRLNSSHSQISYAGFCLEQKKQ